MALWLVFSTAAIAACRDSAVDLKGPWGSARFGVELALTPAQMARGLMHRTSLPNSAGMLFLYEKPGSSGFWMKNTLIPLDMLFITPQGVVRKIHHNAQPGDLTPVTAGPGMIAVLEINGGLARRYGISEGSVLRHPRMDQAQALWKCES